MPRAVSGLRTIRISGCGPALVALSGPRAGQRRAYHGAGGRVRQPRRTVRAAGGQRPQQGLLRCDPGPRVDQAEAGQGQAGSLPARAARQPGHPSDRWSLAQADRRSGRRNLWLCALGAAGLGFES